MSSLRLGPLPFQLLADKELPHSLIFLSPIMGDHENVANDGAVQEDPLTPKILTATVKLPPFYPSAEKFWFVQAESQFAVKGVTNDATKYHHIVSALPQEITIRVMPTLLQRPDYDAEFELTDSQRASKLLHR